jgi:hypothetical protein
VPRALWHSSAPWHNAICFWIASDGGRQTLRDRLSGTYMIYADATPAGTGAIKYARVDVLGLHFVHPVVTRSSDAGEQKNASECSRSGR